MNKVKVRCKLFFRNKSMTTLLIVGLVVSYFIVINGVAMLAEIAEEQRKSNREEYEHERKFILEKYTPMNSDSFTDESEYMENCKKNFENIIRTLETEKGNLMLKGHAVFVGDSLKGVYADVIYSLEDTLNKKIVHGRMPTEEERTDGENVVLVSTDMEKYITKKDGMEQISIGHKVCKVTGIFETNDISSTRADVVMFMDTYTEEEISELAEENWNIVVSYSGDITENDYQDLLQKIENQGGFIDENIENEDKENTVRVTFHKIFMIILFLFSIINCMAISNVWINSRFRELIIRKTIGYSMGQVVELLVCDLLRYSVISMILATILQKLTNSMLIQSRWTIEYSMKNTVLLVTALLAVIAISLILPLIKMKRLLPAKKING